MVYLALTFAFSKVAKCINCAVADEVNVPCLSSFLSATKKVKGNGIIKYLTLQLLAKSATFCGQYVLRR
jgi:hypothetical protein